MEYKKIINLGKIDYENIGKKTNNVTIEMTLKKEGKKNIFSCCGEIWNSRKTDTIVGGQCIYEIENSIKTQYVKEICKLWKKYHLNDMHAGTKKQEKLLKETKKLHNFDYKKEKEILQKNNLLIDNGYQYGTSWLYESIPTKDLQKIYEIMEIN